MMPEAELEKKFEHFPELISNATALLNQCTLDMALGMDKNKKVFSVSVEADMKVLREKRERVIDRIYKDEDVNGEIWNDRIEKNWASSHTRSLPPIIWSPWSDRLRQTRKFRFCGWGSGANSTVAYCLGITNVDPIELDLYSEWFLNEERVSTRFRHRFSWDNRDAIYDYLFRTHYRNMFVCSGHMSRIKVNRSFVSWEKFLASQGRDWCIGWKSETRNGTWSHCCKSFGIC